MAEVYVRASRLQLLGWALVGGGMLRFRAYSVSTRDDRPVSVCVNVVDVCETVWVRAVHVCMFALFLFARMACCLTALAGVSVLAW